ncbi:hypothetical protein SAMN05216459_13335 [Ensifer sp. OV372]|nr:hypothetical protein SAMN05216459_13335 [Ensifer sp. OV372]
MECWADAGPQRLLSTHAANVSSRAEATAGQLGAIENTQRSRCIFRAEPFHLPGAYFCGLSREEVINRIGSVSVETATILTELFRPVRRPPFGFPFADDERVFFVFAFHCGSRCTTTGDTALLSAAMPCSSAADCLSLLSCSWPSSSLRMRYRGEMYLKRIWRCGSFPPHGVKYLRDLYGPLTDRSGSMVTL